MATIPSQVGDKLKCCGLRPQSLGNRHVEEPRTKRIYKRRQRRFSNNPWQCDLKAVDAKRLIAILGDHSRFITATQICKEGSTQNVIWLLDQDIHEYVKPREIGASHGSQFWSVPRGESVFDAYCQQPRIEHILGGICEPTTLIKIKRPFLEHSTFRLH